MNTTPTPPRDVLEPCPFCGEEPDWKRPWENGLRIVGCINASCWLRQAGFVTENIWNRRADRIERALADEEGE